MTVVLIKEKYEHRHTGYNTTEAAMEWCSYTPKKIKICQALGGDKQGFFRAFQGTRLCLILDSWLLEL